MGPAVLVFREGSDEALQAGPSLMFETLPKVFDRMKFGETIGAIFFVLVLFAALTSSISLMETVVSILQDRLHWNRKFTYTVVTLGSIIIGIPSSLGFGAWSHIKIIGMSILDFFDFTSNRVLMPIVAILTCIFIGYVIKPQAIIEEIEINGVVFKRKKMFSFFIRYIAPVFLILILVSSILNAFGIIHI